MNELTFNPPKFVQQEYALFLEQLYSFMIAYTHIFLILKHIDGLFQDDSHGPNQPVKTHKWSQIPEQPSIAFDHAHLLAAMCEEMGHSLSFYGHG